jgi:hypothetical protein
LLGYEDRVFKAISGDGLRESRSKVSSLQILCDRFEPVLLDVDVLVEVDVGAEIVVVDFPVRKEVAFAHSNAVGCEGSVFGTNEDGAVIDTANRLAIGAVIVVILR